MVTLTRIYTRGGDSGETSLGDGQRVAKDDLRIEAFGAVDEANATIGLARVHTGDGGPASQTLDDELVAIQNDLFDLGADLCVPDQNDDSDPAPRSRLRIVDAQVDRLERQIDARNERLAPLTSFVLPAGTPAAAYLHLARTQVRRAERRMVALAAREPVNPAAVRYINRLSDYLFVAARAANGPDFGGSGDVLWVPGDNR